MKRPTRCLDCAVEKEFDYDYIRSFSAELAGLVDKVSANSISDAILYF